jgi:hypothetical protein
MNYELGTKFCILTFQIKLISMIKRIMLLSFLIIWVGGEIYAQTFEGAVLLGANLSQIDGDQLAGYNQPGLNAGARVTINLSERWKASTGLQFAQLGSGFSKGDPVNALYDNIRINTVEVPFLAHFIEWRFRLNAGLTYSRVINYSASDLIGGSLTEQTDLNENILSLALGGAYFFNDQWGIDFLWTKSLTNVQANPDANTFITRNLSFRLIYIL